ISSLAFAASQLSALSGSRAMESQLSDIAEEADKLSFQIWSDLMSPPAPRKANKKSWTQTLEGVRDRTAELRSLVGVLRLAIITAKATGRLAKGGKVIDAIESKMAGIFNGYIEIDNEKIEAGWRLWAAPGVAAAATWLDRKSPVAADGGEQI